MFLRKEQVEWVLLSECWVLLVVWLVVDLNKRQRLPDEWRWERWEDMECHGTEGLHGLREAQTAGERRTWRRRERRNEGLILREWERAVLFVYTR